MFQTLFGLLALFQFGFKDQKGLLSPIPDNLLVENQTLETEERTEEILAVRKLDLTDRDQNSQVNEIFKHNILLSISFLPITDRITHCRSHENGNPTGRSHENGNPTGRSHENGNL